MNDPRREYDRRRHRWSERIVEDERSHNRLANLRLISVAAAIVLGIVAMRGRVAAWWLLAPALAFAVLAIIHAKVLARTDRAKRARRLYERGIDRLIGRWMGTGRDGARFADGHPYARDLDLFGRASLFERLNCARTETGEEALAGWLSAGAPIDEVRARQVAVAELRPMLDFREDMAVLADEARIGDAERLLAWAASTPIRFPSIVPLLFGACALVVVFLAALAYQDLVPWSLFAGWLLVEAVIVFAWRRPLHAAMRTVDIAEQDLALFAALLDRIEAERFSAPWLGARQSALVAGAVEASRAIGRLRRYVALFESSTHNLLFVPVTRAMLVPEQLTVRMARWHERYGSSVAEWFRIAGEFEAIISLATYAYEHPADPFPALVDHGVLVDARSLGHPLIGDEVSVRNDVQLGEEAPHVLVVSGSNMSGKSTLLRALGVNVVLALAGAPVRTSSFRLSPLALGATIRIDDSLQDGRSRFYEEILRIRRIVDIVRSGSPLLFLLDEILQGTNSYDRRRGAEAVVRALVGYGAVGLVTTHDLALTELTTTLGPSAANVHFEDRLEDGRMVFDYRLRPGVVEHSNALALMRAVGLDV